MTRVAFLVPALLLSACASVAAQEAPVTTTGECRNEGLDRFVGQPASEAAGAEMQKVSGAKELQWIEHDTMVTMEFRADRLRVQLGPDRKIVSARCG